MKLTGFILAPTDETRPIVLWPTKELAEEVAMMRDDLDQEPRKVLRVTVIVEP